jgi:hypothetical protein
MGATPSRVRIPLPPPPAIVLFLRARHRLPTGGTTTTGRFVINPKQMVPDDELMPAPRNGRQREAEHRGIWRQLRSD